MRGCYKSEERKIRGSLSTVAEKKGERTTFQEMEPLAWLSKNGWTRLCAAPAARHASRSYEPTGSKE